MVDSLGRVVVSRGLLCRASFRGSEVDVDAARCTPCSEAWPESFGHASVFQRPGGKVPASKESAKIRSSAVSDGAS